MICCGHERDSNFCPECGKDLRTLGDAKILQTEYVRRELPGVETAWDARRGLTIYTWRKAWLDVHPRDDGVWAVAALRRKAKQIGRAKNAENDPIRVKSRRSDQMDANK